MSDRERRMIRDLCAEVMAAAHSYVKYADVELTEGDPEQVRLNWLTETDFEVQIPYYAPAPMNRPSSLGTYTARVVITLCQECDRGGHTCKGCGASVEHGEHACADCNRDLTEAGSARHPAHVMEAGGPDHYAATLGHDLAVAIQTGNWDAVRRIAADPYLPGDDLDVARGALAGALQPDTLWGNPVARSTATSDSGHVMGMVVPAPVEPTWEPGTWAEVVAGDKVRLDGQHVAEVESTSGQVSYLRRPGVSITIRLKGRPAPYQMPPSGEIEIMRGPGGAALKELRDAGLAPVIMGSWDGSDPS